MTLIDGQQQKLFGFQARKWNRRDLNQLFRPYVPVNFLQIAFLFCISALLGRSIFVGGLAPFALPFFVAVFYWKKEQAAYVMLFLLLGTLTVSLTGGIKLLALIVLWLVIRTAVKNRVKRESTLAPLLVFISSMLVNGVIISVTTFFQANYLQVGILCIEAGLAYILTVIFMQSFPLIITRKGRTTLRMEELICTSILIGLAILGTSTIEIYGYNLSHILSRYTVLLIALASGPTYSAMMGLMVGLSLCLGNLNVFPQMSLLGISGVMGGLLKGGKKVGVASGVLLATVLFGVYLDGGSQLQNSVVETLLSISLFLLTPQKIIQNIASLIPGTSEQMQEQQSYLKQVRTHTTSKVEKFATMFKEIADNYDTSSPLTLLKTPEEDQALFMQTIYHSFCHSCPWKQRCFGEAEHMEKTEQLLHHVRLEIRKNAYDSNPELRSKFRSKCISAEKVVFAIQDFNMRQTNQKKYVQQVVENRNMVRQQLTGLANVVENFVEEIQKEREDLGEYEEKIRNILQANGISIDKVEIFTLEKGNVDLEIFIPNCQGEDIVNKIIAPAISDILQETVVVKKEVCGVTNYDCCHVTLMSTVNYQANFGLATIAKGGGFVSGDSYFVEELTHMQQVFALSDGMGNGTKAFEESEKTLHLLKNMLHTGIDEKVAIHTLNSLLNVRVEEEMYATLDLMLLDLQSANAKFLKVGSCPSFVLRNEKITKINVDSLPMGIVDEINIDVVNHTLKPGDQIIMFTDGIYDEIAKMGDPDEQFKRLLINGKALNPQALADFILDEVLRYSDGVAKDDMSVFVINIQKNIPKWCAIPMDEMMELNKVRIS